MISEIVVLQKSKNTDCLGVLRAHFIRTGGMDA
jgi:hypothetical protein